MRTTPVLATAALVAAAALGGPALAAAAVAAPAAVAAGATSSATTSATTSATAIRFAPGATGAAVQGRLPAGGSRTYALELRAEQVLEVSFQRGSTTQTLTLVAPDGTPLHTDHGQDQSGGSFVARTSGTYLLQVRSGAAAGYGLHVTVPQQLRFAPGSTSTSVRGQLPADDDHPYSFAARAGQRATVVFTATGQDAVWFLVGPDGSPLHTDHTSAQQGSTTVQLPTSGTYRLDVRSGAATDYALALTIPR